MIIKEYQTTIVKIKQETPLVKTFRLKLQEPEKIEFLPGQFVMVSLKTHDEKLAKTTRAYSISSSPNENDHVEITLNAHGPFTQAMFKLSEHAAMKAKGPYGKFYMDKNIQEDIALFGAGTGISPLMSMLRHITDENMKNKVTMIYSVKQPSDIIFKDEIVHIETKNKNFSFIPTITRLDEDNSKWEGLRGRVTKERIAELIPDIAKRISFMCGPNEYVNAVTDMLKELSVPEHNIKREIWG